jgi:superfamily II DNA or RNA helicase
VITRKKETIITIKPDSKIESVSINSVKLWKGNPRKNKEAIPKLMELLKVKGQVTPIVVWKKNKVIYKGNTTWEAMKQLGYKVINVLFVDFPSEQSAISYGISDNKSSEWSQWDDSILNKMMSQDSFDFSGTGFLLDKDDRVKFSETVIVKKEIVPIIKEEEKVNKDYNEFDITENQEYLDFINTKIPIVSPNGFDIPITAIHKKAFPFQKDVIRWAILKGRCAIFTGTGTGKTIMQLEWARLINEKTKKPVLIFAPLATANQAIAEAKSIGINLLYLSDGILSKDINIYVTNYERIGKMNADDFSAVVLDESSCIKNYEGAIRNEVLEKFYKTPYKLCCSATPAPNDYMEIGTQAEFLGIMRRSEMLSMYFVHDGFKTSQWRLKGHAKEDFWKWMANWCVMFDHPKDMAYTGDYLKFFDLPELQYHIVECETDFISKDTGITGRIKARKDSIDVRVNEAIKIINNEIKEKPCVIWVDLNNEGDSLETLLNVNQVKGSDSIEIKEKLLTDFSTGKIKKLVTKASIAGFGMNWQHCHNMIFVGMSDSFERYYQAIRRCWRAGQKETVHVYCIVSSAEKNVLTNIQRKEYEFTQMKKEMIDFMKDSIQQNLKAPKIFKAEYKEAKVQKDNYVLYMGDCISIMEKFKDNSIDYCVFSPPFASLYTYSDSPRDMGNCIDYHQFFNQFKFFGKHLLRIINPGRNFSFHVLNLPTTLTRDGYIGITNFRDLCIRMFQELGFIYHSEVCIWKSPVVSMQRTKALGLLHKQLKKDSAMCRQGIPDYVVTMRKPGINGKRIVHTNTSFPVKEWQEYASPIWMDINPSDTLQKNSAREFEDERHICPLQLSVIERCLRLWSLQGDTVLDPFGGIGSTGYVALKMERKFIGIELKESYFTQMKGNCEAVK